MIQLKQCSVYETNNKMNFHKQNVMNYVQRFYQVIVLHLCSMEQPNVEQGNLVCLQHLYFKDTFGNAFLLECMTVPKCDFSTMPPKRKGYQSRNSFLSNETEHATRSNLMGGLIDNKCGNRPADLCLGMYIILYIFHLSSPRGNLFYRDVMTSLKRCLDQRDFIIRPL